MIKVIYYKDKEEFSALKVFDHANFAQSGQDLVCAAVSAICFGGANAVDAKGGKVIIKEAYIEFINTNHCANEVFFTLYTQLKTVNESYPKYISIQEG